MAKRLAPCLRYVLAVVTATALFITAAGLSPATAAEDPPSAAIIDVTETVATTVEDRTVTSETDAGAVGLTLPGALTSEPQVSLAEVPWAVDANDTPIATRFRLDGDTLIQMVGFTPETAFPVVADPNSWWGWVDYTAAVVALIAGNGLAATKIAKIGGVAKLVGKLFSAGSDAERWGTLVSIVGYVTGIRNVMRACG